MNVPLARLYLLCFVRDRYQRLIDHLLSAFCTLVRRYHEEVKEAAQEAVLKHRRQANDDVERGVNTLRMFVDPDMLGETPFSDIRAQAMTLLPSERLTRLCDYLSHDAALDELAYESSPCSPGRTASRLTWFV